MAHDQRAQRRDRQHLQRVPPHDDGMESAVLGAALIVPDAAATVAAMSPTDFYRPAHAAVAEAIGALVGAGKPVDTGTVAAWLRDQGQIDQLRSDSATGASFLVELTRDVPALSSATHYADKVLEHSRSRRLLGFAGELVEAVYSRTAVAGIVSELQAHVEAGLAGQSSSWEPVNLASILAGEGDEATPAILHRTDGQALLYRGRVHAFNAEPESAKSWLALWGCLEVIERGGHALYYDFEDDATTAVERLLALGADPEQLLERFHYVHPEEAIDAAASAKVRAALKAWPVDLCVVDGVGEAMALGGWDEKDAADIHRFIAALPRVVRREGVASVLLDHVVKDPEKRAGYARGSGAKKAAVDAALELAVVHPFGRDRTGMAKITIGKDRHGHLRGAAAQGKYLAEMHMVSTDNGRSVAITLRPPPDSTSSPIRPTEIMARISAYLVRTGAPLSKTALRGVIKGKTAYVDIALGTLVHEGYLTHSKEGYSSVRLYRGEDDTADEQSPLGFEDEDNREF